MDPRAALSMPKPEAAVSSGLLTTGTKTPDIHKYEQTIF